MVKVEADTYDEYKGPTATLRSKVTSLTVSLTKRYKLIVNVQLTSEFARGCIP